MDSITLPYDASAIAANHSSITGLIAGFALAGLFLLVEQVGSSSGKVRVQYLRAMLLLFITSVTATLAAFLYSSIVGIPELRAYFTFVMTSSIFAISAIVLLLGITTVFSAFSVAQSPYHSKTRSSRLAVGQST
jgi:predicted Abi (CAAX) family protease